MAISEFQLALIGTGAVAVVGVWAYNSWQDYRQRKSAEPTVRARIGDAAAGGDESVHEIVDADINSSGGFDEARVEHRADPDVEFHNESSSSRIEPVFTSGLVDAANDTIDVEPDDEDPTASLPNKYEAIDEPVISAARPIPNSPGEDRLDPMIELGMALPATQRVAALYAAWLEANVDFRKRVHWIGREPRSDNWTDIDKPVQSSATHAYVAIQLADRQGAIDKSELATFCQTADAIATARGERTSIPSLDDVVAHARALDDVCASVDIQIAIHVVGSARQSFAGTKLRGLLEVAGLGLAADGVFYLKDGEGKSLFSVCDSGAIPFDADQMRTGSISDATFWLDVPRVADGAEVFDLMLATARQLAASLDGVLVDDQRNPLADNVLAGIRDKVIELQHQMASHGVPAGGRRALRLFA